MGKNLQAIRENARHGKAVARDARTSRYSSSRKPRKMHATRLTPDTEAAKRNRARQQLESATTEAQAKRSKRHGTVTHAKLLSEDHSTGFVTVELKVWGMGETFIQHMPHSDYVSLTSSL